MIQFPENGPAAICPAQEEKHFSSPPCMHDDDAEEEEEEEALITAFQWGNCLEREGNH